MIDSLCKDLIKHYKINRLVETGTDKGETVAEVSRWFSEINPDFGDITDAIKIGTRSYRSWSEPIAYPIFSKSKPCQHQIYSVDVDEHSYKTAREIFKSNCNIFINHGSSQDFLKSLLAQEIDNKKLNNNYLFFLDAHWGKYWPLRDELTILRELDKYLVVIDDFMVPGKSNPSLPHGDFGFDLYKRRILDWAYICDVLANTPVRVFYPQKPNRDQRGWVLITHGYSKEELQFLESLALFEVGQFDKSHTTPVKTPFRCYLDAKNILKMLIPVSVLRQAHRVYEKVSHK